MRLLCSLGLDPVRTSVGKVAVAGDHDPLRDCWLSLMKMAGLRTTKETPGLLLDSNGRPDHQVFSGTDSTLTDVRTCTITAVGYHSVQRAAALPGYSAECAALLRSTKSGKFLLA